MTQKEYTKRMQFLHYIEKNFHPEPGKDYVFYFTDYNISTIRYEVFNDPIGWTDYVNERSHEPDGAVILYYDRDECTRLFLRDKYIDIRRNVTFDFCEIFDTHLPIDMERVREELAALFSDLSKKKNF